MTQEASKALADELTAWVETYAHKICPEGCLPTLAQEREINLFARIAIALRVIPAPTDPVAWAEIGKAGTVLTVTRGKGEFNTVPLYLAAPSAVVADSAGIERATIERCAKICDAVVDHAERLMESDPKSARMVLAAVANGAMQCAEDIRALSPSSHGSAHTRPHRAAPGDA